MSKKDSGWSSHKISPLMERAEAEKENKQTKSRRHPIILKVKVFTLHLLKLIKPVYHNQRKFLNYQSNRISFFIKTELILVFPIKKVSSFAKRF
jgi:hypothetical protein